jgi:EAL domain-containing protein (putative c-di-GMP-specific phosphodiesterase class I)
MVAPSILLPLAEHSGVITEIGGWVLGQAWADRQHWQNQRQGEGLAMSVNVSAHQLLAPAFAASVAAVLDSVEADPGL